MIENTAVMRQGDGVTYDLDLLTVVAVDSSSKMNANTTAAATRANTDLPVFYRFENLFFG